MGVTSNNVLLIVGCLGAATILISSFAFAGETERQCKVRLMETTKMNAISGDAVGSFVPDSDPDTLEVVFLSEPEQGKSRVSDDGQVIFVNAPTNEEQQALINQAFDIRVKLGFCARAVHP